MRPPESFKSPRLTFEAVRVSDAPAIFEGFARHPGAMRFMNMPIARAVADAEAFAVKLEQGWRDGTGFAWALRDRSSGEFVGSIELRLNPPTAGFGYVVCEALWGRGYATEAARAVADWCMDRPGIERLWATCHKDNTASLRVLEKAGLIYRGVLKNWEARPQLGETAGDSLAYCRVKPGFGLD